LISFSLPVFFLNCGAAPQPADNYTNSYSSVTGGGGGGGGGDPGIFKKGDLFDYSKITNSSTMVQQALTSYNYNIYPGAKAVAITQSGLGFVYMSTLVFSQSDADQGALEGCFAISGGQPCALIASGGSWALNANDLPSAYKFTMSAPTGIDASMPFVPLSQRQTVVATYLASAAPKALAVSLDGTYSLVASTTDLPVATQAEANRLALERCEMTASVTPCTLFAQGSTVALNPSSINRTPAIDYARFTLSTNIPTMRDAVFKIIKTNYIDKVKSTSAGVLYITADGRGGYAINAKDDVNQADADAKAACVAYGVACYKYSIQLIIQNLAPNLGAIRNMGMDYHCKVVPRATCAAHYEMGCSAGGTYYVMGGNGVPVQTVCQ
jgi:hypothetical protein